MSETKVGQSVDYEIAGRKISLKPLPLGKVKKATLALKNDDGDNLEKIANYLAAILDNNADVTKDWILENISLPQANDMIDTFNKINGIDSFFKAGGDDKPAEIRQERPLQESPQPTRSA